MKWDLNLTRVVITFDTMINLGVISLPNSWRWHEANNDSGSCVLAPECAHGVCLRPAGISMTVAIRGGVLFELMWMAFASHSGKINEHDLMGLLLYVALRGFMSERVL